MTENPEIQEDLGKGGKFKNWLQDNIRIILSVLIVITIATGIYSYSKRTITSTDNGNVVTDTKADMTKADNDKKQDKNDKSSVVVVGEDTDKNKTEKKDVKKLSVEQKNGDKSEKKVTNNDKKQVAKKPVAKKDVKQKETPKKEIAKNKNKTTATKVVKKETPSKAKTKVAGETENSFIEVAKKGDSLTTLSRQALKHYLAKNPTKNLTKEHKIFIEDYLRKKVKHSTLVLSDEKVSFSKSLIKEAISASQGLNNVQLKNLQKYSARVTNL